MPLKTTKARPRFRGIDRAVPPAPSLEAVWKAWRFKPLGGAGSTSIGRVSCPLGDEPIDDCACADARAQQRCNRPGRVLIGIGVAGPLARPIAVRTLPRTRLELGVVCTHGSAIVRSERFPEMVGADPMSGQIVKSLPNGLRHFLSDEPRPGAFWLPFDASA